MFKVWLYAQQVEECGNDTFIHCWWECKSLQIFAGTIWLCFKVEHEHVLWLNVVGFARAFSAIIPDFFSLTSFRFLFVYVFFPLIAHVFRGEVILFPVLLSTGIISPREDLWPKEANKCVCWESCLLGNPGLKETQSLHCHWQPPQGHIVKQWFSAFSMHQNHLVC